jgi:adenosylcobinamide-GDP ribazoletransferase
MPETGEQNPPARGAGFALALGLLTVFPVRVTRVDRRLAGRAMLFAPLIGALLGTAGAAALTTALMAGLDPFPAAVLTLGALAAATRGLHLDGLADLADGLGSGRPAGAALDIMKRSDIGPFGVMTLLFVLLLQAGALAQAASAGLGPHAVVAACVAGRLAVTWACGAGVPPARPEGLGALVAGTVRRGATAAVTVAAIAATGAWAFAVPVPATPGQPGGAAAETGREAAQAGILAMPAPVGSPMVVAAVAAVLVGLVAAWAVRRHAVRRLGGITGDVLGALVESAATGALVVFAITAEWHGR